MPRCGLPIVCYQIDVLTEIATWQSCAGKFARMRDEAVA